MTKKSLLFATAFAIAIGAAFTTQARTRLISAYSQVGLQCNPSVAPNVCTFVPTGTICTNFYNDNQCTQQLRKP